MNESVPLEQARELQKRLEDALACFKESKTEELQQSEVKYHYQAIMCFLTTELGYVQGMVQCLSNLLEEMT